MGVHLTPPPPFSPPRSRVKCLGRKNLVGGRVSLTSHYFSITGPSHPIVLRPVGWAKVPDPLYWVSNNRPVKIQCTAKHARSLVLICNRSILLPQPTRGRGGPRTLTRTCMIRASDLSNRAKSVFRCRCRAWGKRGRPITTNNTLIKVSCKYSWTNTTTALKGGEGRAGGSRKKRLYQSLWMKDLIILWIMIIKRHLTTCKQGCVQVLWIEWTQPLLPPPPPFS